MSCHGTWNNRILLKLGFSEGVEMNINNMRKLRIELWPLIIGVPCG